MNSGGAAGDVREACAKSVQAILDSASIPLFKIGITADPVHRMTNDRYGYIDECFVMMNLVFVGAVDAVAKMEKFLINRFKSRPGCKNIALGGESADKLRRQPGPAYTYVVHVDSDAYTRLRVKKIRQQQQ